MSQGNPATGQDIEVKVPTVIVIFEQHTNSLWTIDCFLLAFTELGPGPGPAAIVDASKDSQEI